MNTNVTELRWTTEPTARAEIFLAGPRVIAEAFLRQFTFDEGLCVTVEDCKYIYTGGEESGVRIGLINYPRFPSTQHRVTQLAKQITEKLLQVMYQWSATVVTPKDTYYVTRRKGV